VIKQWATNLPQLKGHVKLYEKEGHFIEENKHDIIGNEIIDVACLY